MDIRGIQLAPAELKYWIRIQSYYSCFALPCNGFTTLS